MRDRGPSTEQGKRAIRARAIRTRHAVAALAVVSLTTWCASAQFFPTVPTAPAPPPAAPTQAVPSMQYSPTPQPIPPSVPPPAYSPPPATTAQPDASTSSLPAWPPAVLPYPEGQPIPKAYRLESHANTGLIIGGLVTFLASYSTALVFAASHDFDNGLGWTALPVVGPYGAIGARSFGCTQTDPRSSKCLNRAVDEVKAVTFLAVD